VHGASHHARGFRADDSAQNIVFHRLIYGLFDVALAQRRPHQISRHAEHPAFERSALIVEICSGIHQLHEYVVGHLFGDCFAAGHAKRVAVESGLPPFV